MPGGCCFWEEFCHSWGVGMEKLFHIVRVYQLAQGRLSLFPEFYSEIFWDFYGFGDDSVMLEKKYGYTLPYHQWWMVGTGKTFNLPLSMILRIGYGFGEEFGNVGEEWICIRYSICPGAIAWGDHLASKSWHPTDNQPAFGRSRGNSSPKKFLGKLFPDNYPLKWKYIYPWKHYLN